MKTYYAECTCKFTDEVPEEDTYHGEEYYSFTLQAKNLKQASKLALDKAQETFYLDLGETDLTEILLDDIYETSEDARAD
jgi:hypothetical protein